jgi:hypothetical protein
VPARILTALRASPPGAARGRGGVGAWLAATAVATVAYAYALTTVNLPEQWGYWIGGGVLLGAAIGRWHALLGALAPFVFVFTSPASGSGQEEVNSWVVLYYVPGTFVAILLGLAARAAVGAAARRRSKRGR